MNFYSMLCHNMNSEIEIKHSKSFIVPWLPFTAELDNPLEKRY